MDIFFQLVCVVALFAAIICFAVYNKKNESKVEQSSLDDKLDGEEEETVNSNNEDESSDSTYEDMTNKQLLIQICKNTNTVKNIMLFYVVLTILSVIGCILILMS